MLNYADCHLRLLALADKERILEWRNSARVRANMYSDHLISPEEHDAWFAQALQDSQARYLVFTHQERPVGFVSFTAINRTHGRSSWAFYLGETDVPRGAGSAMELFALDYAFATLQIRKLCCEVFVFNSGVIKLHEKFGFVREGLMTGHYLKDGRYEDIVCLARFGAGWAEQREALHALCFKHSERTSAQHEDH